MRGRSCNAVGIAADAFAEPKLGAFAEPKLVKVRCADRATCRNDLLPRGTWSPFRLPDRGARFIGWSTFAEHPGHEFQRPLHAGADEESSRIGCV